MSAPNPSPSPGGEGRGEGEPRAPLKKFLVRGYARARVSVSIEVEALTEETACERALEQWRAANAIQRRPWVDPTADPDTAVDFRPTDCGEAFYDKRQLDLLDWNLATAYE